MPVQTATYSLATVLSDNCWGKEEQMWGVPTPRGDTIDTADLGVTMMHEHIFGNSPEINQNYPATWTDEEAHVQQAITELSDAKDHGVDTIVDLTVIGLGRSIPRIKRIAHETAVNIVV